MSKCLTWFPISGLGEPNIYHDLGVIYKCVDFTWRVVSLDWITGRDFGKKFRMIRKEDKLNYKI